MDGWIGGFAKTKLNYWNVIVGVFASVFLHAFLSGVWDLAVTVTVKATVTCGEVKG